MEKTVENKKAEERSRDVAYLRTFVFNFPIPKFLFKLIFHSGWAKTHMVSHAYFGNLFYSTPNYAKLYLD